MAGLVRTGGSFLIGDWFLIDSVENAQSQATKELASWQELAGIATIPDLDRCRQQARESGFQLVSENSLGKGVRLSFFDSLKLFLGVPIFSILDKSRSRINQARLMADVACRKNCLDYRVLEFRRT